MPPSQHYFIYPTNPSYSNNITWKCATERGVFATHCHTSEFVTIIVFTSATCVLLLLALCGGGGGGGCM